MTSIDDLFKGASSPAAAPASGGTSIDKLFSGAPAPSSGMPPAPAGGAPDFSKITMDVPANPKDLPKPVIVPQIKNAPAPAFKDPEATKSPIVAAITGGSTLKQFASDTFKAIPEKVAQLYNTSADFWSETPLIKSLAGATAPEHADTAGGLAANTFEGVLNSLSGYGTGFLSGITGGMMKAPDTARTDQNENAPFKQALDKTLGFIGQGVGMFEGIGAINKLTAPLATPSGVVNFLGQYPRAAKYAIPLIQNAVSFGVYSQLDPALGVDLGKRGQTLLEMVGTSPIYTALGAIKSPAISLPASFALGFGMAKFSGAENGDAIASGIAFALLDGAARSGDKPDFVNGRKVDEALQAEAFNTINHFSDVKINSRSSPEEVKAAYLKAIQKAHPDKPTGSDQAGKAVNSAYQYLTGKSDTVHVMSPDEHNTVEAAKRLAAGHSEEQVIYSLSDHVGAEKATGIVEAAKEHVPVAQETAAKEAEAAKPKEETTSKAITEKTPADIQIELADRVQKNKAAVEEAQQAVKDAEAKVETAAAQSAEKRDAKIELSNARAKLKDVEANVGGDITANMKAMHDALQEHVRGLVPKGTPEEHIADLATKIGAHAFEPELVRQHAHTTLAEIAKQHVKEYGATMEGIKGLKRIPEDVRKKIGFPNGKNPAVVYIREMTKAGISEKQAKAVLSMAKEAGEKGFYDAQDVFDAMAEHNLLIKARDAAAEASKPRTKKEQVKEAVAKKGEAKAGDIAKETGVLEPSVRRILGEGAKEGTFERVGDGVYRIKVGDKEVAWIIPGDAVDVLPKLVEDGFKSDMVFLDIPYNTPAVKGGNRGVKYDLISVEQFSKVLDSVKKILRSEDSALIYMYSQAKSGLTAMQKYNDLLTQKGFVPVARGEYTKMQKDGITRFRNMRGNVIEPEGIILLNQSGKIPMPAPVLDFKLARPKGYSTEKPAEMLKALIEMTTSEGDTVLDPFAGSGVTADEAVKAGRKAVAIEKDEGQAKKIAERVGKAALEKGLVFDSEGKQFELTGKKTEPTRLTRENYEGQAIGDKKDKRWFTEEMIRGTKAVDRPKNASEAAQIYREKVIFPLQEQGKAVVIGADDLKDYFGNDYDPSRHKIYSEAADILLKAAIVDSKSDTVKWTAAGAGAGKTDFIVGNASKDFSGVIYDSTAWNYDGIVKQIEYAESKGKKVEIYGIIPDLDVARAYTLIREAKGEHPVSDTAFIRTHSGAIETLIKLIKAGYPVWVLDARGLYLDKNDEVQGAQEFQYQPLELLESLGYSEGYVRESIKGITAANAKEVAEQAAQRSREGGSKDVSQKSGEEKRLEIASRLTLEGIKKAAETVFKGYKISEGDFEFDGKKYKYEVSGVKKDSMDGFGRSYANTLDELADITHTNANYSIVSKGDLLTIWKNNPDFRSKPFLTVEERDLPVSDHSPGTKATKVLAFKFRHSDFAIKASALGLDDTKLEVGDRIRFDPVNFQNPAKEVRVIRKDGEQESIHASAIPEEKVPREKKEKAEKKPEEPKAELNPAEMYNAKAAIEKGKPKGFFKTALKEIATLFNPVGQASPRAVDVIMRNKGDYERKLFRTEQTYKAIKNMWDAQPEAARLDFLDAAERGAFDEIAPEFVELAKMYNERLDNTFKAISQFKKINYLENFFPHFWKDPKAVEEANIWAKAAARRPLQGTRSFLKSRVFATIQDGIKAGYELSTSNPEELVQLHEQNVWKFVMAQTIHEELKPRGFSKYVSFGQKPPPEFSKIDDAITKVYGNPNIPVMEAFDEIATEKLDAIIDSLGIGNERSYNIGKEGVLGYTGRGLGKIVTKFGTPLSVKAHELGHQLDYKYNLQQEFKSDPDRTFGTEPDPTAKELRDLADLRYEGHDVTEGHKQYVRSWPEKMAVMLEAYIHAPELFKKTAPNVFEKFETFLLRHEELRPLMDVKPSLVLGVREDTVSAGGAVIRGEWYMQRDVARLINNFLSRDFLMDTAIGKGLMNTKNTMNAFELGLSAFHLTMETLDTIITKFSIGLSKVAHGDLTGFKDMAIAPLAPATYFYSGWKFYRNDPSLAAIEKDLFTGGASLRSRQYYKNTVFDEFNKKNREIWGMIKRGEVLGAGKKAAVQILRLPLSAIEATMRPLFSYYIPRLKVGAFRDLFASELQRNALRLSEGRVSREEIARTAWNNIENRMGELNYDNLFWNRGLKTSLMLAVRAVGWNLGTVRELGGGAFQDLPVSLGATKQGREDYKKYGFDFTPKQAYTLSLFFIVAMISSIYQYLHTGRYPGEKDDGSFGGVGSALKDMYYPRNGAKTASGDDYRVELPTYLKDIYQSGVPQALTGHPFAAVDSATRMLKNKSAPELSTIFNLMNNRDFYDNMIRNPNDATTVQMKQVAIYLLQQFEPFTIQQQQNLAQGKSDIEQQTEAFFGIIKAPKEVIQSDFEKQLDAIYADQMGGHAPETPEQQAAYDRKVQVADDIKKGDYSGLQGLIDDGIIKPSGLRAFIQAAVLSTAQKKFRSLNKDNKDKLLSQ